jgi:hypothetical protein
MRGIGCLWHRSRIEPYADETLGGGEAAAVARHLDRCSNCRKAVEGQRRLRVLLRSGCSVASPSDWSGFWPTVRRRILAEVPRPPIRESWWVPIWKPVWGHPRMAVVSTMALVTALALVFQPIGPRTLPEVEATPILVQDATTADPDASVMVYSSPDNDVTVIWLLRPHDSAEAS